MSLDLGAPRRWAAHGRRSRLLICCLAAVAACSVAAGPDDPVDVADSALRQCLEGALDKEAGDTITEDDMASLSQLSCDDRRVGRVADLSGLEFAHNLETLTLVGHRSFSDLSPLAELTSLTALWLGANVISDASPLAGLTSLTQLDLGDNALDDVSDLRRLTSLTYLGLYSNDIDDVSALRGMTALNQLYLQNNRISDISDLAANDGLGDGDYLELQGNPLNSDAYARHIPALQERGVTVYFDPQSDPETEIRDRALRRCLEQALDKESGETITEGDMTSLTRLTCRNAGVADLSGLEGATDLTRLDLDGNEIDDLRPLAELAELRDLRLRDNEIEDIRDLADNTGLGDSDYIDLRGNPLNARAHERHIPTLERRGVTVDFDPQSAPVTISDAALRYCVEEELRKGAGAEITEDEMSTLDRLSCRAYILPDGTLDPIRSPHGAVASLSGLEFATNLEELGLRNNAVTDLSPLAELDSLAVLTLGHNRVRNIAPLADLPLTELSLPGNNISDFTPLARLRSLRVLTLVGSGISDLSPLAGLRSLTQLWLGGNTIEDVSPLARLTSLTQLDLGDNSVEDVSSLGRLTSVTYLGLYSNAIADVSALRTMTSLADVHLQNNRIADILPLAENDGLGRGDYLDLTGNPLDGDAYATHIPALQERGVRVYFDPSTDPAVGIADRALRRCVEQALDKDSGATITESELASLTSLSCRNAGVADLSGLEEATSLTKLELDGNAIEDVSPLGELEALLYLGLRDNQIEDIEALADNAALGDGDYIELRGNPLNDEAHDRHIPTLEGRGATVSFDPPSPPVTISDAALRYCVEQELRIEAGAEITEDDMATLDRLFCNLRLLSDGSVDRTRSPHGAVTSLAGLEHATNVVEFRLRRNTVEDLSPLAELDSLAVLRVGRNRIRDISPIAGLRLTHLDLAGNNISDFTPLARITSLRALWLTGSRVSDLSPLAGLRSLTELWLGGNAVSDVSPLARLTSLTQLNLGANEIENVSGLRRLTSVTYLGLYSNAIDNVAALRTMTSLQEVHLQNNRIADIADLVANDSLGRGDYLDLLGNPLDRDAYTTHIPTLQERGVTVYFDPSNDPEATIADRALRRCLEQALDKEADATITESEVASLTTLTCRNAGVVDLSGLEEATALTRLELDGNAIEDVSPLGELEALLYLGLRDNAIEDIEALADNAAFGDSDVIELRGNPLNDEAHERHIPALEGRGVTVEFDPPSPPVEISDAALRYCVEQELRMEAGAEITEAHMATLDRLFCNVYLLSDGTINRTRSPHGAAESLAGLEFATNLVELRLRNNAVDDLSPLAELASLSVLRVGDNRVTDIAPVAGLPLTELSLAGNPVSDYTPLARITSLRQLTLTGNRVSDLSPLADLTSLTQLWLGANAISDVSPLARLRSLTHLNLGANAIQDVSSLGELNALVYLGLYSNAIADVSSLRWMTSLSEAYLANNRISDIAPLVANDGLAGSDDYVDLQGNPIACGSQAEQVKLLRDRGVNVYADRVALTTPDFAAIPGDRLVELRWSRPAGCHVDGYEYRHGVGESPDFGDWATIDDSGATQRTVDALANGQVHVFELRVVGAYGPGQAKRVHVTLAEEPNAQVEIPDAQLSAALAEALAAQAAAAGSAASESDSEEEAPITQGQLAMLTDLDLDAKGIADLNGLEYAVNLRSLSLAGNAVGSLSPVASLRFLATLDLSANGIADISTLTAVSFPGLRVLSLTGNDLTDISALGHLQDLTDLRLDGNEIVDITALTSLARLQRLWLNDNAIVDIEPLSANEGLGQGAVRSDGSSDYVDLRGNPLNADALDLHAPHLRRRGAAILVDADAHLVPFFAHAGDSARSGILRIVNPNDEAGEAGVTAIDDGGLRLGPVTIAVDANRAVHFDSDDLENGNAEIGLSEGVGMGTGDWRLEVRSASPLQVFAYMRGPDGLTTSMNTLVPEAYAQHRVSMFKAAGAGSRLRVINATAKNARVLVEGVDDAGATASVAISVRAATTQDFTAAALEGGTGVGVMEGGLGDGVGDWRLTATSYDGVQVLHLLGSAGGHWTNLSTEPSASAAASEGSAHLPLFLSAAASQGARGKSVARIVNRSARSGSVAIRALDAQGRSQPAGALALAAGRTVEFNSTELEQGDAERGLTGLATTDVGQSDWRLLLASDLDIRASAYVEAQDGYFGSLNELVSASTSGARQTHEVLLFNAASQQSQASRLRLINSTGQQANVRISGLDDAGSPGAAVAQLAIPAGATRELTASELEAGSAEGVTGALGEGTGQWRLRVESDARIEVMNLVESASGHLSNLSR